MRENIKLLESIYNSKKKRVLSTIEKSCTR